MSIQLWRDEASCAGLDDDVFFPASVNPATVAQAKAVCLGCPVLDECRRDCDRAEADTPPAMLFGIFAGEIPTERWQRRQGIAPTAEKPSRVVRPLVLRGRLRLVDATAERFPNWQRGGQSFDARQTSWITGCSARQLRYWDELGIAQPSIQGTGGRAGVPRRYSRKDLDRLVEVRRWAEARKPLKDFPA